MFFKKKEPNFSTDWFSHATGNWQKFLQPYIGKPDVRYLEIGVFEGRSMAWVLENILTGPNTEGVGIDTFHFATEEEVYKNLRCFGVEKKCTLINGRSEFELRNFKKQEFDIIYIDGDHRARGAFLDLALSWDLLKDNGTLIFDDYGLFATTHPAEARPQVAGDCFLTSFQNEFDLIFQNQTQFAVRKKRLFSGNFVTEFGDYSLDWGVDDAKRELTQCSTRQRVNLSDEDFKLLAKIFINRPLGQIKPQIQGADPSQLKQLEAKLQHQFSVE